MIAGACAFGLKSTLEACTFVDSLGEGAVGEVVITGREGPRGAIFVERGRICWAGALGLARRLGELLRAGDRREALLMHTLESIELLYAGGVAVRWSPRAGRGYEPRFTFGTTELVAYVGGAMHADAARRARDGLEAGFADGRDGSWGAAFVRSAACARPLLVGIRGPAPGVESVLRYGKWAASSLDVTSAFAEEAFLAVERRALPGRSIVAFRDGDVVFSGETGAHGAARILNRRASQRRQRGIHADL